MAEVVEGSPEGGRFVVCYRLDGRVTGIVGWNMAKQARLHRQDVVDDLADQKPSMEGIHP